MGVNEFLAGKKTYITSALMVLYGVLGMYLELVDGSTGIQTILAGLSFAGLRNAK